MIMERFNITYNQVHNTSLIGSTNGLKILLPNDGIYNKCLINLKNNQTQYKTAPVNTSNCLSLNLKNIIPGRYMMQIFRQSVFANNNYDFCFELPIVINSTNRMVDIEKSPMYDNNKTFYMALKTDHNTIDKYKNIQRLEYNESIARKVKEITRNYKSDYSKVQIIHDYISENIVYDMDSYYMYRYNNQKFKNSLYDVSEVYKNKMAICEGFSNLTCYMLRMIGIPAIKICCHALGVSSNGTWTTNNDVNHVFTGAFVNDRWMLIDSTWDCTHELINGALKKKRPFRRLYFDPTLEFISLTHKLCYIDN